MVDLNWKNIRLLVLDFDGTLTDGFVCTDQNGMESVRCSRRDSLGIEYLKKHGIEVIVLSKETNLVVAVRCKKMKVQCVQSITDGEGKKQILERIIEERNLSVDQIVYMGDDINDREPMELVGIGVTVKDGHEDIKSIADYITSCNGGDHAVREVCDLILKSAKGEVK